MDFPEAWNAGLLGVLGLLIGSFLNVVVYRLPLIMQAQWRAECADLSGTPLPESPAFNLVVPRSRCPHCNHQLSWFDNVPVLSYLLLRGQCRYCRASISQRYPAVELATAVLFSYCGWRFGLTAQALLWSGFAATLLTLALIDWDTTLLPDDITLPLLWAGLVAAAAWHEHSGAW
jgi:leader peptidase (prepilin peptidase)/N-methyltransferase